MITVKVVTSLLLITFKGIFILLSPKEDVDIEGYDKHWNINNFAIYLSFKSVQEIAFYIPDNHRAFSVLYINQ